MYVVPMMYQSYLAFFFSRKDSFDKKDDIDHSRQELLIFSNQLDETDSKLKLIIDKEVLEIKTLEDSERSTGFEDIKLPSGKASISMRESIVLPLLTIQQYALKKIQELEKAEVRDEEQIKVFEKIVMRSLFGNINASRNSA